MRIMGDNMKRLAEISGANCSVSVEGTGVVVEAQSIEDFEKLVAASGPSAVKVDAQQSLHMECIKTFPKILPADYVRQLGQVIINYAHENHLDCSVDTAGNDLVIRADNPNDFARMMIAMDKAIMPAVQEHIDQLKLQQQQGLGPDFSQPNPPGLDH